MEECDAGKSEAVYKFPDSSHFSQAASVTFKDVNTELARLKTQLKSHSLKVKQTNIPRIFYSILKGFMGVFRSISCA